MSIDTSLISPGNIASTSGIKQIYFGHELAKNPSSVITVTDTPIHIIAPEVPLGCTIRVERLYSRLSDDCAPDVPPAPIWCSSGCDYLSIFRVADPDCPSGYREQNELWLAEAGNYHLVMEGACDPKEVVVYGVKDSLATTLKGCNFPTARDLCPPDCVFPHVILTSGLPSAPPDCMRCEAPIAYDSDTECRYFWAAAPGSNCSEGMEEGAWVEDCLSCPDTDEVTIQIPNDGEPTTEYVWMCDGDAPVRRRLVQTQHEHTCCDTVASFVGSAGGGLCIAFDTFAGDGNNLVAFQSRDSTFVTGSANIITTGTPGGVLTLNITNPFSEDALLIIDLAANGVVSRHIEDDNIEESFVFTLGDTLSVPMPYGFPTSLSTSMVTVPTGASILEFSATDTTPSRSSSVANLIYKQVLTASESITLYGQWWAVWDLTNQGGPFGGAYHGHMAASYEIYRGVV